MHLRHILLLGSLALLGACKEERLVLHFNQSVAGGWGIDSEYEQAILRGLSEAGVDSSQASLSMQNDGLVVAVALPGSALGQAQQQSLAIYFDKLLKDRADAEKVRLRIHTEAMEDAGKELPADIARMLQEKAGKMRPLFTSRIESFDDPRLAYEEQEQRGMRLYENSQVLCQVSVRLERPLPHIDYKLTLPGSSPINDFLALQTFRLPSSLSIGNDDLDQGVADGLYDYQLVTSRYATTEHADELVFLFGEMGEVLHSGGATTTSLDDFQSRCLGLVTSAGRPFTFHYGHSLDRLVAVDYRFADQPR